MARIKYVINERRLAYENAMKIYLRKQRKEERKVQRLQASKTEGTEAQSAAPEATLSDAAKLAADSFIRV